MCIVLVSLIMLLVIFLWSACIISSRISREEEKNDYEKVFKNMD